MVFAGILLKIFWRLFLKTCFFHRPKTNKVASFLINIFIIPYSPTVYFCLRIVQSLLFLSTHRLLASRWKIGTTYSYYFEMNSRSFATAFYGMLTTSFSLYPFLCLSCSTGYCSTFSQNKLFEPTFAQTAVADAENFAISEALKHLLRYFLQHSLKVDV